MTPPLILEFGDDPAVGFGGRLLALTGSRVVKIESPGSASPSRTAGAKFRAPDRAAPASVLFHYLNQGKHSVTIDVALPGGAAALGSLVERADAVLVDQDGIASPTLSALLTRHRRSVEVRVTAFGPEGPRCSEPASSASVFASAGEASTLPGGPGYRLHPDGPPLVARGHLLDFDAGVIVAMCTTAALCRREAGGAVIDVSKQEAEASLNRWLVSHFAASGWIESRATRAYAFAGLMPCRDGYVMLQPTTDAHWAGLKAMMGSPAWAEVDGYATQDQRLAAGRVIQDRIAQWVAGKSATEVFEAALAQNVPAAPFRTMRDVACCPQFGPRGFFVEYAQDRRLPGLPFRPHPAAFVNLASAPDLGQDTQTVLSEYSVAAGDP